MEISEEQRKQKEEWTQTAISIISFLQDLPSPLGEFVFQRIVEDAYKVANVIETNNAKQQLIESICNNLDTSQSSDLVWKYLNVMDIKEELETIVTDKDKLKEKLTNFLINNNRLGELPDKTLLVKTYPCFSPHSGEKLKIFEPIIRQKLMYLEVPKKELTDLQKNLFQKLGYKVLFINWASGELKEFDELFINWYCIGNILNVVIDTAFKCDVNEVSQSILKHIEKECQKDRYLSNAFKKEYESYKKYSSKLLPFLDLESVTNNEDNHKNEVTYPALPKIRMKSGINEEERKTCLGNLHELLQSREYIECTYPEFEAVFSGKENPAKPIKWRKPGNQLALFLAIVNSESYAIKDIKANKDIANIATKLFYNENNKPFKYNTLHQLKVNKEIKDEYIDLLKKANIEK